MRQQKKILVAALNWGLGHATRCIPIINELENQGAQVFLASDGRALDLLKKEFPKLKALPLPPYGVEYQSNNIITNVVRELPGMIHAVYRENRLVQSYIEEHGLHGVISDNRMGCFNQKVHCAFITHQINLLVPNPILEKISRQLNYWFISRYHACWVPDVETEPSLSGMLCHDTPVRKIKFIGALSRMENYEVPMKYDAIAVISGPEPQRTRLETKIVEQARDLPYQFLIVQGKTELNERYRIGENIEVVSCLTTKALNTAILQSKLFIGRTGYSSLMDLAKLGKPAFLTPTPGQTEQEYLGERLEANGIFYTCAQDDFHLAEGIEIALKRGGLKGDYFNEEMIRNTIECFLEAC